MAELAVALDVPSLEEALDLVDRLGEGPDLYKVGLQLFTLAGPRVVRGLRKRRKRVFLDLKLHDIPNTVKGAVRAAADLDVELLTVHASGGVRMVAAAREAAEGTEVRILAVTILTSLTATEVGAVWGREALRPGDEALRLALLAREGGAHGVVASPAEARELRTHLGPEPLLVTPGIRLADGEVHDQRRVADPATAVAHGADVLVVGRAITGATDPVAALARVREAMEAGTEETA